jgi:probable F420-dependent oxidoreductase
MRVGLSLPQVGQLADPAAIRAAAIAAEQAGYASLWVRDRALAAVTPQTPYPGAADGRAPDELRTVLDPFAVLTLAAAVTDRTRLGTSVLVAPWYPPLLLARSLAAIDRISAGRLKVGLGLGWSQDEYDAVGVPRRGLAVRIEEAIDVLDAAWGPDPVEYAGPVSRIAPAHIGAKPVQQPRPPLLLAAYTPAGLERVARRADGWIPNRLPVGALGPMFRAVRDLAAGHGRDPDALQLVVRASIQLQDQMIVGDRPSYAGTLEQVAADLDATRAAGAHEVILAPAGQWSSAGEMLDVCDALVRLAELPAAG